jgi:hypothetical protein
MASSGMLRCVALVRTDVSEELGTSFMRVTRIGEIGTTFVFLHGMRRMPVTASVVPISLILVTPMKKALNSSETSVLTRATRHNIPGDAILHVVCTVFTAHVKVREVVHDIHTNGLVWLHHSGTDL